MAQRRPLGLGASPDEIEEFVDGDTVAPPQLGTGTPSSGVYLRGDGAWAAVAGAGIGDVFGPASSTDERLARFDGATGKLIQESAVGLSDAGAMTGVASIAVSGTVDGRDVSVDGAKLDGIATGAELNTASNVAVTAAHGIGRGVWKDKSGSDLRFRPLVRGRQVSVPTSGDDLVVAFEPSRFNLHPDLPRRYRARGSWIAGATVAPTTHGLELVVSDVTVDNASHYTSTTTDFVDMGVAFGATVTMAGFAQGSNNGAKTVAAVTRHQITVAEATATEASPPVGATITNLNEHLHPFMLATVLDHEGFPHDRHQRLESNLSSGSNSRVRGYEAGDFVAKGDALLLRRIVYEQSAMVKNVGWSDAFVEHALEPNPQVTVAGTRFTGANRMRMLSGELGLTWSGERLLRTRIELVVDGAQSYSWSARWRLFGSGGAVVWERETGGSGTSFNWASTDAVLQLRWRVDRIAKVDTYDDANQGANQGANLLRLDVREHAFLPGGA